MAQCTKDNRKDRLIVILLEDVHLDQLQPHLIPVHGYVNARMLHQGEEYLQETPVGKLFGQRRFLGQIFAAT